MRIKTVTKNRVLVEPIAPSETAKGLYIPEASRDVSSEGIVVKVGPETPESGVKVGDRVYFERYGGVPIQEGNKTFKLLNPDELIAIIE